MNGTMSIKTQKIRLYPEVLDKAKYDRIHVYPDLRDYVCFAGTLDPAAEKVECVVWPKPSPLGVLVLQLNLSIGASILTRNRQILKIMMHRPNDTPAQLAEFIHTDPDRLCEVLNIKFDYRGACASNGYVMSKLREVSTELQVKAMNMGPAKFVPMCMQLKKEQDAAAREGKAKKK